MSHALRDKPQLLARVRRIRGQIEAVERAIESEQGCAEVLQLVASIRGAVNGLTFELLEDHLREHVVGASTPKAQAQGVRELLEVLERYIK